MRVTVLVVLLILGLPTAAFATVVEFTNKSQWQSSIGTHEVIPFTGYPQNTVITDQYSLLGVHFTDGLDLIFYNDGFLNDGVGLYGAIQSITVAFASPQYGVAVEFPGSVAFELYLGSTLMYTSNEFVNNPSRFAGLMSDQPFTSVRIFKHVGGPVYIDDLYFGPPIPAPGALPLLGVTALAFRTRRRP